MHFGIVHTVRYTYCRDVFLEPHVVRMQPRSGGDQMLQEFDLHVEPRPAGITHCLDAEGNSVASVWFDGEHRQFTVTARSRVRTRRENPFDFLLSSCQHELPIRYDEGVARRSISTVVTTVPRMTAAP